MRHWMVAGVFVAAFTGRCGNGGSDVTQVGIDNDGATALCYADPTTFWEVDGRRLPE